MVKYLLYLFILASFATSCQASQKVKTFRYPPDQDTVRYIPYRQGDTWFFIDRQKTGPFAGYAKAWNREWDYLRPFDEYGLSLVGKNKRYGWMNNKGEMITPVIYLQDARSFSGGKGYAVMLDTLRQYVIINRGGKIIAPVQKGLEFYGQIRQGCFVVHNELEKTWGLMDTTGQWRIPPGMYKSLSPKRSTDTSNVYIYGLHSETTYFKEKYGFIRNDGTLITDTLFESTGFIAFGVCPVNYKNSTYGLYNVYTNQMLIDSCNTIYGFYSEISKIKKKYGQVGAIDTTGKLVIPMKYSDIAIEGSEGFYMAERDNKWGVVSYRTGEETSEFIYDGKTYNCYHWGMFAFTKDGKGGVVDPYGKVILPFEYDKEDNVPFIESLTPHLLAVRKNGQWMVVNRQNEIVIPPMPYQIARQRDKLWHGLIDVTELDERGRGKRIIGFMDLKGNKYWED